MALSGSHLRRGDQTRAVTSCFICDYITWLCLALIWDAVIRPEPWHHALYVILSHGSVRLSSETRWSDQSRYVMLYMWFYHMALSGSHLRRGDQTRAVTSCFICDSITWLCPALIWDAVIRPEPWRHALYVILSHGSVRLSFETRWSDQSRDVMLYMWFYHMALSGSHLRRGDQARAVTSCFPYYSITWLCLALIWEAVIRQEPWRHALYVILSHGSVRLSSETRWSDQSRDVMLYMWLYHMALSGPHLRGGDQTRAVTSCFICDSITWLCLALIWDAVIRPEPWHHALYVILSHGSVRLSSETRWSDQSRDVMLYMWFYHMALSGSHLRRGDQTRAVTSCFICDSITWLCPALIWDAVIRPEPLRHALYVILSHGSVRLSSETRWSDQSRDVMLYMWFYHMALSGSHLRRGDQTRAVTSCFICDSITWLCPALIWDAVIRPESWRHALYVILSHGSVWLSSETRWSDQSRDVMLYMWFYHMALSGSHLRRGDQTRAVTSCFPCDSIKWLCLALIWEAVIRPEPLRHALYVILSHGSVRLSSETRWSDQSRDVMLSLWFYHMALSGPHLRRGDQARAVTSCFICDYITWLCSALIWDAVIRPEPWRHALPGILSHGSVRLSSETRWSDQSRDVMIYLGCYQMALSGSIWEAAIRLEPWRHALYVILSHGSVRLSSETRWSDQSRDVMLYLGCNHMALSGSIWEAAIRLEPWRHALYVILSHGSVWLSSETRWSDQSRDVMLYMWFYHMALSGSHLRRGDQTRAVTSCFICDSITWLCPALIWEAVIRQEPWRHALYVILSHSSVWLSSETRWSDQSRDVMLYPGFYHMALSGSHLRRGDQTRAVTSCFICDSITWLCLALIWDAVIRPEPWRHALYVILSHGSVWLSSETRWSDQSRDVMLYMWFYHMALSGSHLRCGDQTRAVTSCFICDSITWLCPALIWDAVIKPEPWRHALYVILSHGSVWLSSEARWSGQSRDIMLYMWFYHMALSGSHLRRGDQTRAVTSCFICDSITWLCLALIWDAVIKPEPWRHALPVILSHGSVRLSSETRWSSQSRDVMLYTWFYHMALSGSHLRRGDQARAVTSCFICDSITWLCPALIWDAVIRPEPWRHALYVILSHGSVWLSSETRWSGQSRDVMLYLWFYHMALSGSHLRRGDQTRAVTSCFICDSITWLCLALIWDSVIRPEPWRHALYVILSHGSVRLSSETRWSGQSRDVMLYMWFYHMALSGSHLRRGDQTRAETSCFICDSITWLCPALIWDAVIRPEPWRHALYVILSHGSVWLSSETRWSDQSRDVMLYMWFYHMALSGSHLRRGDQTRAVTSCFICDSITWLCPALIWDAVIRPEPWRHALPVIISHGSVRPSSETRWSDQSRDVMLYQWFYHMVLSGSHLRRGDQARAVTSCFTCDYITWLCPALIWDAVIRPEPWRHALYVILSHGSVRLSSETRWSGQSRDVMLYLWLYHMALSGSHLRRGDQARAVTSCFICDSITLLCLALIWDAVIRPEPWRHALPVILSHGSVWLSSETRWSDQSRDVMLYLWLYHMALSRPHLRRGDQTRAVTSCFTSDSITWFCLALIWDAVIRPEPWRHALPVIISHGSVWLSSETRWSDQSRDVMLYMWFYHMALSGPHLRRGDQARAVTSCCICDSITWLCPALIWDAVIRPEPWRHALYVILSHGSVRLSSETRWSDQSRDVMLYLWFYHMALSGSHLRRGDQTRAVTSCFICDSITWLCPALIWDAVIRPEPWRHALPVILSHGSVRLSSETRWSDQSRDVMLYLWFYHMALSGSHLRRGDQARAVTSCFICDSITLLCLALIWDAVIRPEPWRHALPVILSHGSVWLSSETRWSDQSRDVMLYLWLYHMALSGPHLRRGDQTRAVTSCFTSDSITWFCLALIWDAVIRPEPWRHALPVIISHGSVWLSSETQWSGQSRDVMLYMWFYHMALSGPHLRRSDQARAVTSCFICDSITWLCPALIWDAVIRPEPWRHALYVILSHGSVRLSSETRWSDQSRDVMLYLWFYHMALSGSHLRRGDQTRAVTSCFICDSITWLCPALIWDAVIRPEPWRHALPVILSHGSVRLSSETRWSDQSRDVMLYMWFYHMALSGSHLRRGDQTRAVTSCFTCDSITWLCPALI